MTLRPLALDVAEKLRRNAPRRDVEVRYVDLGEPPQPVSTVLNLIEDNHPVAHIFLFERGMIEVMAPFGDGEKCRVLESDSVPTLRRFLLKALKDSKLV